MTTFDPFRIQVPENKRPLTDEGAYIISALKGRWAIKKDGTLYDTELNIRYDAPKGTNPAQLYYTDIPDLTAGDKPLPFVILWMLVTHPVKYLDLEYIADPEKGLKVKMGDVLDINSTMYWELPEDGLRYKMFGGAYRHVPGASGYIVNDEGTIRSIPKNKEITIGSESGGRLHIVTDSGEEFYVESAYIASAAFSKFTYKTSSLEIIAKDGDKSNLTPANLMVGPTVVAGKALRADEATNLRRS